MAEKFLRWRQIYAEYLSRSRHTLSCVGFLGVAGPLKSFPGRFDMQSDINFHRHFAVLAALLALTLTERSPALAQGLFQLSPKTNAETMKVDERGKRQALVVALAELEIRTHANGNLYLPPNALMTREMNEYYRKIVRAIEFCGFRFFPKEGEVSIYGKGAMAIFVDKLGNLVGTEVVASSGKQSLDRHMADIVKLAAPFGQLPERVLAAGDEPFHLVVAPVIFNFSRSESDRVVDESASCSGG